MLGTEAWMGDITHLYKSIFPWLVHLSQVQAGSKYVGLYNGLMCNMSTAEARTQIWTSSRNRVSSDDSVAKNPGWKNNLRSHNNPS